MSPIRSAFTLFEAIIAVTIFAGVMVAIIGSMQTGSQLRTHIATSDAAGDTAARAVSEVARELRYADINKIYLDNTDWRLLASGGDTESDYYSFKVASKWDVVPGKTYASFSRLISYDRGIVLRFRPDGNGTGTLLRSVYRLDPATGQRYEPPLEKEHAIAGGLCWQHPDTTRFPGKKGFFVTDPTQADVSPLSKCLKVHACAFIGDAGSPVEGLRPWRETETEVFLRASQFDTYGLQAPQITSAASVAGNIDTMYTSPVFGNKGTPDKPYYRITATNDPTRFYAAGLPAGLTCDAFTGAIVGTPSLTGTFTAVVSAQNDIGSSLPHSVSMTIFGPAPTITSPLAVNILSGEALTYAITATGSPSAFGALNLPPWLSFVPPGNLAGIAPTVVTSSITYEPTITATNSNGTTSAQLAIRVSPQPPSPPVISTSGPLIATINQYFSRKLTASENPSLWTANVIPPWLSLDPSTGMLTGIPDTLGSYSMAFTATNEAGSGPMAPISMIVQEPLPAITSPPTASAEVGMPFTYTITALNGPTSFGVSPAPPAWLIFLPTTGQFAGIPTSDEDLAFTISATNALGSATAELKITVVPMRLPTITLPAMLSAIDGVTFSHAVAAAPGVTSYGASSLPSGLAINPTTGMISGKPSGIGDYLITVSATNPSGMTNATSSLKVVENTQLPKVDLAGNTQALKKFSVLGTINPGSGGHEIDANSFAVIAPTGLTLKRGWIAAEKGTLASNQFLVTSNNVGTSTILTVSVTDMAGNTTTKSRSYP